MQITTVGLAVGGLGWSQVDSMQFNVIPSQADMVGQASHYCTGNRCEGLSAGSVERIDLTVSVLGVKKNAHQCIFRK